MRKAAGMVLILISILASLEIGGQVSSIPERMSGLEMKASTIRDFRYSRDDAPIEIVMRNNLDLPVRFLNVFDDPRTSRTFFSVVLRDKEGTPFGPFGGGKISLLRKNIKYVELKKGDEFRLGINLKDFVPSTLKPGDYEVSITYFNQYGEDCFQGTLESKNFPLSLY
jgi:hypothetical protein